MEEDNAARLIIRYLSREASVEEEEELLVWISQDASHQKIFNEWVELWNTKPVTDNLFDLTRGLRRINNEIDASEMTSAHFTWRKIAAAIAILLVIGSVLLIREKYSNNQLENVAYEEKQTIAGQKLELVLSDGSKVFLNANSSIKYPNRFANGSREVFLTGEAFFEVAKDMQRPFIVHTHTVDTRVLGTSFNVNAKRESTTVSVVTGKVQVSREGFSELAVPNEKIVYTWSKSNLTKSRADLEAELAWRSNTIILEDAKLSEAAEKLHEVYGYTVVFEKETLKTCLITGKFKDQALEAMLKAMAFTTNVQYRVRGKTITIYGQGCDN